jgi:serine protease
MKIIFAVASLLVALFICMPSAIAQKETGAWHPERIIFSTRPEVEPLALLQQNPAMFGGKGIKSFRVISKRMHIWSVEIDSSQQPQVLAWLKRMPEVVHAQYDHYVQDYALTDTIVPSSYFNVQPNDSLYTDQWHHNNTFQIGNDLGSPDAWAITTGGLSPYGDTIVIAVIDGGFAANHPDWGANLWRNRHEIPNDGYDNDQNGYRDDYLGWNVLTQTDQITGAAQSHGTGVAGIIGARGNNQIGMAGVNWQTKLMLVPATGNQSEADILEGYDYVLANRVLYNQTNGERGAFVVAVNCSFGINYGTPLTSPIWCSVLDSLGQAGILTIGAVANLNVNVDQVGDIPTTCPSQYLLTVTSLTRQHTKPSLAAFGQVSVDLGAYGWEVQTLAATSPFYAPRNGTSFAAPQASGAVGLLYSAPCKNLTALAHVNPAAATALARDIILYNTQPVAALTNLTNTGGRLDLSTLMASYQDGCQTCPAPYNSGLQSVGTNTVTLQWDATAEMTQVRLRWRQVGNTSWEFVQNATSPYQLSNLSTCTPYEFSVQSMCPNGQMSAWTDNVVFSTDGCCLAPSSVSVLMVTNQSVLLDWEPVTASESYTLRYRANNEPWMIIQTGAATAQQIGNLATCTRYEVQMQSTCNGTLTPFSDPFFFETTGCGSCEESTYCTAKGVDVTGEWIAQVEVGSHFSNSSAGYAGYQMYTLGQLSDTLVLYPDTVLQATITPGFSGIPFQEMFRIFLDTNMDGDFTDSGELVFDPGFSHDGPMTSTFTVPDFGVQGITRMRVMMKYKATVIDLPEPCETFPYGQVEDYCIILRRLTTSVDDQITAGSRLRVSPQPARSGSFLYVEMPPAPPSVSAQIRVMDTWGRVVTTQPVPSGTTTYTLDTANWPAGLYQVEVINGSSAMYAKALITN